MKENFTVAFAVNNGYVPYLEVTLFSLLKNNLNHRFEINVLSSDITDSSEARLKKITDHFGNASITILRLNGNEFKDRRTIFHFSRDIYSRYLLPELLPNKDRVLYLDSDILITGDIAKLYTVNIDGFYVAGINDIGINKPEFRDYLESLDLLGSQYINSGVLVMNLKKIRDDKKVEQLLLKTAELEIKLRHPDQDVINIVFKDTIKQLKSVWNFQDEDRKRSSGAFEGARVIHYTTKWKPWNTPNIQKAYNKDAHELYEQTEYEYLATFGYAEKVSVILPVFNTPAEYLRKSYHSVKNQTYKNLEIIFVDDGSNNETALILDQFANEDYRIKVIHKQNAGTNEARHAGFEASTGEFITFVDSDDMIEHNMVLKLFRACRNDNTDMAVCEYWDSDVAQTLSQWVDDKTVIKGRDDISRARYVGFPGLRLFGGVVWAKLYRRQVVGAIAWDFSDYAVSEDEFMSTQIFIWTKCVSIVRDQLYCYRRQITTNKELNYPKRNRYKNNEIPMVQTARELYEKSKQVYDKFGVSYDSSELLSNYVATVSNQVHRLILSGNFDEENQKELAHQKKLYLQEILDHKKLPEAQKFLAIVTFDSPTNIERYNVLIRKLSSISTPRNDSELDHLRDKVTELLAQNQSFLSIKRSIVLLAGNIKRKLRIRTRIKSLLLPKR